MAASMSPKLEVAQGRAGSRSAPRARRRSPRPRSRSASSARGRRRRRPRRGSGCCRRRLRAACGKPYDGRRHGSPRNPLRDPRLAPGDDRAADARAQGHRVQAPRPDPGGLEGGAARRRLPGRHRARAEASTARRSRARARSPAELDRVAPEPPLFPAEAGGARGRRGGRAAGATRRSRRPPGGSCGTRCAATAARSRASPRAPGSACRSSWRWRRRRRSSRCPRASTRRRTRTSAPTSRRCRATSTGSTAGSPTACSAVPQPNAADFQISTSVRLLMTLDDLRAGDREPAGRRDGRRASSPTTRARSRRSCRRTGSRRWARPPEHRTSRRPIYRAISGTVGKGELDRLGFSRSAPPRAASDPRPRALLLAERFERLARAACRPAARGQGRARAAAARTNRRLVTSGCGSSSRSRLQLDVAEQQQVDVDRPRAVARAAEHAPELALDRLADVEQLLAARGRSRSGPRRSGSPAGRGTRRPARSRRPTRPPRPRSPCAAERRDRPPQVRPRVADVGAEPEVAAARHSSPSGSLPSSIRSCGHLDRDLLDRERQRGLRLGGANPCRLAAEALHEPLADHLAEALERLVAALGRGERDDVGRPRRSRSCPRCGR